MKRFSTFSTCFALCFGYIKLKLVDWYMYSELMFSTEYSNHIHRSEKALRKAQRKDEKRFDCIVSIVLPQNKNRM